MLHIQKKAENGGFLNEKHFLEDDPVNNLNNFQMEKKFWRRIQKPEKFTDGDDRHK